MATLYETEEEPLDEELIGTTFMTNKERLDLELAKKLRAEGIIIAPGEPFEESRQKELDGLRAKDVYRVVRYDPEAMAKHRLYKSRFVNEVKLKETEQPIEKTRLVIQAYNDQGKQELLTASPAIMRVSQRLVIALIPTLLMLGLVVWLRDITQAFAQCKSNLFRTILSQFPKEIADQFKGMVMQVLKPLYGIPEAGTHWFGTYQKHHRTKLNMVTSTYDPCLLITEKKKPFGLVAMQVDDTLAISSKEFKDLEDSELAKAKLQAKPHQVLSPDNPIAFNGGMIVQDKEGTAVTLTQKGQGERLELIDMNSPTWREEYKAQRARGGYLATICQPEAAFDLSVAAQHQEPTEDDVKALNKCIQWQIDNQHRGIRYIQLIWRNIKLYIFVDGSFANNKDLTSQIGYTMVIANEEWNGDQSEFNIKGNILHWSSTKCKRVTRAPFASEVYGMVSGVDIAISVRETLNMIMEQLGYPPIPLVVCTDSKSLYDCLVKLGTTSEKRLMIDIMALRESYEHRVITEIRCIHGDDNPSDAMTKERPNKALTTLIDTNELRVRTRAWVERPDFEAEEE